MTLSTRPSTRRMTSRLLTSLALVVALSVAGCASISDTSSTTPNSVGLISTQQAIAQDVKIRWFRIPASYDNDKSELLNAWRVNDTIYLSSADFRLIALDADTGKTLWKQNLGYVPNVMKPAEWGNYLICLSTTQGLLLDRRNGKVVNRTDLPFSATTPPLVVGTNACIGTGDSYFYGLYIDLFCKLHWPIHSELPHDAFVSPPTLAGGRRIVVASRAGLLWCVDPDFGSVIWKDRKVTGQVLGGLGADVRSIYVPSMDQKVFAFDCVDSGYLWDTHLEGTLDQTVIATRQGRLLVPSTGKGLYCLETEKGRPQWVLDGASQIVSLSPTHVYVTAGDGVVKAVRLNNGVVEGPATDPIPDAKVDKTFKLDGVKFFATNLRSATVYAITADGRMMAIEPEDINP